MTAPLMKETVVGLIADPGLPMTLARWLKTPLENLLGQELDSGSRWRIETEDFSLPVDTQGEVELTVHSTQLKESAHWDYVVYLTDLPKYENGEPLISSVNAGSGSAVVVLPSLGFVRRKRLLRAVLQVLAALHGVGDPYLQSGGRVSLSADPLFVERRIDASDVNDDAFETAKGLRGRILLLLGMVRSNRPWRLVPKLSTAMAAAVATGAFGVFYTSIWSMADFLPPPALGHHLPPVGYGHGIMAGASQRALGTPHGGPSEGKTGALQSCDAGDHIFGCRIDVSGPIPGDSHRFPNHYRWTLSGDAAGP